MGTEVKTKKKVGRPKKEKEEKRVKIDETMVDETICRLCLQGKTKEYIAEFLIHSQGIPEKQSYELVEDWYQDRDSIDFTTTKKSLVKWLQTSMADCMAVGDKRGATQEARLLTRLLSIDPSKDSAAQQLAKEKGETDQINIEYNLKLD